MTGSMLAPAVVERVLEAAAAAPSAHNSQPWHCIVERDTISVGRSYSRDLAYGDPTGRQAIIAIGMFVETLAIAAGAAGLRARVTCVADRPCDPAIAQVHLLGDSVDGGPVAARLAAAIGRRRTCRGWYHDDGPVLVPGIAHPRASADLELRPLSTAAARGSIAELAGEAMRIALSVPRMRRELAAFIHTDRQRPDGMLVDEVVPEGAPVVRDVRSWLEGLDPQNQAAATERRFAQSPLILAIGSSHDDPTDWFEVGRLGMRILLHAAADGLCHDIAAGPVEIPTLSERLRVVLQTDYRPQLLMRVGRPERPPLMSSPRRRLPPNSFIDR
jgi:nitroreductase